MIQATDFVCPTCRAQVGKPCVEMNWLIKAGKPHPERRKLARLKRKQKGATNG